MKPNCYVAAIAETVYYKYTFLFNSTFQLSVAVFIFFLLSRPMFIIPSALFSFSHVFSAADFLLHS